MPVLAIITGDVNKSQYETLRQEVNWERDRPQGGLIHAAGFDDAGRIHVSDVWESADDFNAFVAQRLTPAFEKLSIPPPEVNVYPLHNMNAMGAIDRYKI